MLTNTSYNNSFSPLYLDQRRIYVEFAQIREQGLEPVLQSSINLLPGEIRGLFRYHQEQTGYSADEILIQSLFFHFPEIFRHCRLDLNLHFFFYLNIQDQKRLTKLQHFINLDSEAILSELFPERPEESYSFPSTFPNPVKLTPLLADHVEFKDFPPDRRYSILLQKLILQFHLFVQPLSIFHASLDFQLYEFYLSGGQAASLLDLIPRNIYHSRKANYYIQMLIYTKFLLIDGMY